MCSDHKSIVMLFRFFISFLLGVSCFSSTVAQSCEYRVDLFDSFGDGWNGASINVGVDGVVSNYTIPVGGSFQSFSFQVQLGDQIEISYVSGDFDGEVTYFLFDSEGAIVFQDGPNPVIGPSFISVAFCPKCPTPSNISIDEIRHNRIQISWDPADTTGYFEIEYDEAGFAIGTGTVVNQMAQDSMTTISGLEEGTEYDLYITFFCDSGDTSRLVGPMAFTTKWEKDVGVVNIYNPVSGCGMGADEMIGIEIFNFGGVPQTFIPVNYMVNNLSSGVQMPDDGFFTDIVGYQGSDFFNFETTFDFSAPGTYEIIAWTDFSDGDITNDSFSIIVENFPSELLPLIEDFESGYGLQEDWIAEGAFANIGDFHSNGYTDVVLSFNLYSFVDTASLFTDTIGVGPINAGDSLSFDYRLVNFSSPNLAFEPQGDFIEVQISSGRCSDDFQTVFRIDQSTHDTTQVMKTEYIDLSAYEGEDIIIRYFCVWETGDWYFDLDNINIIGCASTFAVDADINFESNQNANDGLIKITPTAGLAPHTYAWDNGSTNNILFGLDSDDYIVTITDALGCTEVLTFTIGVCTGDLGVNFNVTDASSSTSSDGRVIAVPTLGLAPYTFEWDTGDTGNALTGIASGTYEVTVTDSRNCMQVISVMVGFSTGIQNIELINSVEVYPNPTMGSVQLSCQLNSAELIFIQLYSADGKRMIYLESGQATDRMEENISLEGFEPGVYYLSVSAGQDHSTRKIIKQ